MKDLNKYKEPSYLQYLDKRYISPGERQKVIDDLKLIW